MSIYISLFHGRDNPDQDMNGWGFNGPVLGPFDSIHGTYATHLRCIQDGSEVAELPYHDDMLVHEGKYYGDFAISSDKEDLVRPDPVTEAPNG